MDPLQIKTIVIRPGRCFTATAAVFDQDGGTVNDYNVTWHSSNPAVAAPEKSHGLTAKVWAKKPGQATLMASCGTAFQTFLVRVEALKPLKVQITFGEIK
jgi:uncharacterized protein YjdB